MNACGCACALVPNATGVGMGTGTHSGRPENGTSGPVVSSVAGIGAAECCGAWSVCAVEAFGALNTQL